MSSSKRRVKKQSSAGLEEKAREYAFLLLKFRLRSEQELCGRMKQKKFPPAVIDSTMRFLKEKKFIDDSLFSRAWLDSRLKRSIGIRRIKNELRQKRIKPALIEGSVEAVREGYNEDEVVRSLISRKLRSLKGLDIRKTKQRLYAFLFRRGFSSDAIADNLNQILKDES